MSFPPFVFGYPSSAAGMAELVDAPDLKSGAGNGVPVQLRLPAAADGGTEDRGQVTDDDN